MERLLEYFYCLVPLSGTAIPKSATGYLTFVSWGDTTSISNYRSILGIRRVRRQPFFDYSHLPVFALIHLSPYRPLSSLFNRLPLSAVGSPCHTVAGLQPTSGFAIPRLICLDCVRSADRPTMMEDGPLTLSWHQAPQGKGCESLARDRRNGQPGTDELTYQGG